MKLLESSADKVNVEVAKLIQLSEELGIPFYFKEIENIYYMPHSFENVLDALNLSDCDNNKYAEQFAANPYYGDPRYIGWISND